MGSSGRGLGASNRGGLPGGPSWPEKINRYTIKRLLGEGGQGAVYHAYDPNFAIDVAVKVLHPDFRSEEFVERFKIDAQTTVRLTAPNVVRVFDFDLEYPYLVMEYCGDGDLNRYIKSRRRRSLRDIMSIARQICEALVAAHENDPPILHRDIKPGNVLFQKSVPKVTDFGLAKMLSGGAGLTTTRGMMGTFRYCSPEQLRDASKVDHRADLWSVGVVLYELLTWTRPFDKPGDTDPNIMLRVIMEPPRQPPYDIPAPVMAVIAKALQKSADERFSSAREMRDAIDRALASVPGSDGLLLPPEHLVDELSRMADRVASLLEDGRLEDASGLVRDMRRRAPEDSLVSFWQRRLKERSDTGRDVTPGQGARTPAGTEPDLVRTLDSIQTLINGRNYTEARREIGRILIEHPDNSIVHRLLEKLSDEERRLREALDQAYRDAERARAEGDPARVRDIWKRFNEAHADLSVAQAELAVAERELAMLEQRRLRDGARTEANRLRDAGDLRGALLAWRGYTTHHPADQEAAREAQEIQAVLTARERADKVAALETETTRRRDTGDLPGALDLWLGYLQDDPTSTEASRAVDALRAEIAGRERERRLQATRSAAAASLAAQDHRGAVRAWEAFLSAYPQEPEARQQVETLRCELAEQERRIALVETGRLLAALSARFEGQRYRGVAQAGAALGRAIEGARPGLKGDARALSAAKTDLAEAERIAEVALAREVAARREALQNRVHEYRDWLPRGQAVPDGASSAAGQQLEAAYAAALHALCETRTPDTGGDPLEPLVRTAEGLVRAAAALTRERREAVEDARARAVAAVQKAEESVQHLASVSGGDGLPAPDSETAGTSRTRELGEKLARLRMQADSQVPELLAEAARQATGLAAEADAARTEATWGVTAEIGRLLGEARLLAIETGGDTLQELVRRVASALDAGGSTPGSLAPGPPALRAELRREIETARRARDDRLVHSRKRWTTAQAAWRELVVADLGKASNDEADRVAAAGEAALAASRPEELDSWAAQLEGLTRRYRLESAWIEQSNALLELEGPLDHEGLPEDDDDPEIQDLLARYRRAMAMGDGAAVRSLGPPLEARAKQRRGGAEGPADTIAPLPVLGLGPRRFNERYATAMLKAFDDLSARFINSLSQGRKGDAARTSADLEGVHAKLLVPPPVWKRSALHVGAAAVLMALLAWAFMPAEKFSVTAISPRGVVRVKEVRRGGEAVDDLPLRVPEGGVVWSGLPPGRYVVTLENGARGEFEVPGIGVVQLPSGEQ